MDRRTAVPARAGGLAVLLALLVVMSGATTALVLRAVHVARTLPDVRVEPYLELLAVAVGALAAVWVGAGALVGLGCLVARALGRSWSTGERLVVRAAPAVVRRAVRAGVGLTVGAGLVLGGGAAQAATTPDAEPGVVAVDLGWQRSASDPEATGPTEPAPRSTDTPTHTPLSGPPADHDPQPSVPAPDPAGPESTVTVTPTPAPTTTRVPTASATAPAASPETGVVTTAEPSSPVGAPEERTATTQQRDAALQVVRDVAADGPREVVVVRGDSLWSIAARHLPAGAPATQVADAVQRWYAANLDVVGDDPDLVRPGQVLVAPPV
jgi:nucleoid-associated protein YgaU